MRGVLLAVCCGLYGLLWASEPSINLLPVKIEVTDRAALQRGAAFYMNYCSGCHSLKYLRYNRMATDLGLTTFDGHLDKDLLVNNLLFTHAKIEEPITIAMSPEDARQWFGVVPPDLSLIARARGASWLYTFLKGFYADPARPLGANNVLMPDTAMPNVLEPLIGRVIWPASYRHRANDRTFPLVLVEQGEMSAMQVDAALQDLVTFLVYAAEPAQLIRYPIGIGVLIFLIVLGVLIFRLKKAYWKQLKP